MATTKSSMIAAINGFITSIVSVLKHRNSMLELVNEFYQVPYSNQVTGTDVIANNILFKKQGNIVHINGFFQNKKATVQQFITVVPIVDSKYYAKSAQDTVFFGISENTGNKIRVSASNNSLYLLDPISPNERVYVNNHYQTND